MRWLWATAGLLTVSFSLLAWVYLRDRDTASWHLPERPIARVDAASTLSALGGPDCHSGCAAVLLRRVRAEHWLVRITVRGRPQCLMIDLETFSSTPQHGLSGVQPSRCEPS